MSIFIDNFLRQILLFSGSPADYSVLMTPPTSQVTREPVVDKTMEITSCVGHTTKTFLDSNALYGTDVERQKTSVLGKRSSPTYHSNSPSSKIFALSPGECDLELSSFSPLASPLTPTLSLVESSLHKVASEQPPSSPLAIPLSTATSPAPSSHSLGDIPDQPSLSASPPELQTSCCPLAIPTAPPILQPLSSTTMDASVNKSISVPKILTSSHAPASPPPPVCLGWCSLKAGVLISYPR